MNYEEFKKFAIDNVEQAASEICLKALNQRNSGKVNAFDQVMEKNIIKTKDRVKKMLDTLTEESYEAKKTGLQRALLCENIKAQCHKEVFYKK